MMWARIHLPLSQATRFKAPQTGPTPRNRVRDMPSAFQLFTEFQLLRLLRCCVFALNPRYPRSNEFTTETRRAQRKPHLSGPSTNFRTSSDLPPLRNRLLTRAAPPIAARLRGSHLFISEMFFETTNPKLAFE